MFIYCNKLEGLDLSKWDTRNVTNFSYMFFNTSVIATSKVWYYGANSTNIYDNRSTSQANYITFEYKSN